MNADNFVKECHLLAEDAKLVSKDKEGNVMLPASFFGELSGILHELGIQARCPYYIDEKQFDKKESPIWLSKPDIDFARRNAAQSLAMFAGSCENEGDDDEQEIASARKGEE